MARSALAVSLCILICGFVAPQASLKLLNSQGAVCHHNDTAWALEKSGELAGDTVVWTVTATRGATSDSFVVGDGFVTIQNTGTADATIGNIVVNLQRRSDRTWVTTSSVVADATSGDAAVTAKIVSGASSEGLDTFTENAASGSISFTDATSNTIFSLVPQVTLAPGASIDLLWSAEFNNTILGIPTGEFVRFEVIVSFGNAGERGGSGASAPEIDINGSGAVDADEAWVRSVPTRLTLAVPALEPCNNVVTLGDPPSAITATGTVTFTGYLTDIGGGAGSEEISATTTRTVAVGFDAGALGGTITNTATLTGQNSTVTVGVYEFVCCEGISLTASDTQVLTPDSGFEFGDYFSYTQGGWGAVPNGNNPGSILNSLWGTLYPAGLEVGISGAAGFSIRFTSSGAVTDFLPQGGPPGALNADLVNPTSSSARVFGGQVTALRINVDFGDHLAGQALAGAVGDLVLSWTGTSFDGLTVAEILAVMEAALGGGALPAGESYSTLNALASALNESFDNGNPTAWAQDHLSP